MTHPNQLPLTHPQTPLDNIKTPFEGDVLQRKRLAEKMTGYLARLKAGAVIAIDAPWGEGKSWFGRNWAAQLKVDDYRVVYIDAFEQDYVEDPFLLIATELSGVFKSDEGVMRGFLESSTDVARALLPFALKAMINIAGTVAFNKTDIAENVKEAIKDAWDGAMEDSEDAVGDWVKEKFEKHADEKNALINFRKRLSEIAAKEEKPIVIFVDELDRCRPDFAVKLIERIKHFFNVENVVFVLLLNREQLQVAVKGLYGEGTNASSYLGKFVNFFFMLPKIGKNSEFDHVRSFMRSELGKYKGLFNDFIDPFARIACFFRLSLRDLEKALSIYVFSGPVNPNLIYYNYVIYAICLKVANPDLYQRILRNEPEAHNLLTAELWRAYTLAGNINSELGYFSEWHKYKIALLNGDQIDFSKFSERFPVLGRRMGPDGFSFISGALSEANDMIDLSIYNG